MRKITAILIMLLCASAMFAQTTGHPALVPNYSTMHPGYVVGYQYGDRYIVNDRDGRHEIVGLLKLEPEAYQLYRNSNLANGGGDLCLIAGLGVGLFGWKSAMLNEKSVVPPLVAGGALLVTGYVLIFKARKMGLKSLDVFNSHAYSNGDPTHNIKSMPYRFGFGFTYLGTKMPCPSLSLTF